MAARLSQILSHICSGLYLDHATSIGTRGKSCKAPPFSFLINSITQLLSLANYYMPCPKNSSVLALKVLESEPSVPELASPHTIG